MEKDNVNQFIKPYHRKFSTGLKLGIVAGLTAALSVFKFINPRVFFDLIGFPLVIVVILYIFIVPILYLVAKNNDTSDKKLMRSVYNFCLIGPMVSFSGLFIVLLITFTEGDPGLGFFVNVFELIIFVLIGVASTSLGIRSSVALQSSNAFFRGVKIFCIGLILAIGSIAVLLLAWSVLKSLVR